MNRVIVRYYCGIYLPKGPTNIDVIYSDIFHRYIMPIKINGGKIEITTDIYLIREEEIDNKDVNITTIEFIKFLSQFDIKLGIVENLIEYSNYDNKYISPRYDKFITAKELLKILVQ